jgi:hypothetical protein
MSEAQTGFDPAGLLRLLQWRGVRFIVIADVLRELHAELRGATPGLPFPLDWRTFEMGDHFTFTTEVGDVDCLATPSGTAGYPDLAANAVEIDLGGITVRISALDDLIRMKRAAGRPKDRIELEVLGALRDELDRQA